MGAKSRGNWNIPFCTYAKQCMNHPRRCRRCVNRSWFRRKAGSGPGTEQTGDKE